MRKSKRRTHAHAHTPIRNHVLTWDVHALRQHCTKEQSMLHFPLFNKYYCACCYYYYQRWMFLIMRQCIFPLSLSLSSIARTRNQVGNKKRVNSNNNDKDMYNVHIHKMREKRNVEFRWRRKKRHVETQNLTKKSKARTKKGGKIFNKIGNVCAQFFVFISSSLFHFYLFYQLQFLASKIFYGWN